MSFWEQHVRATNDTQTRHVLSIFTNDKSVCQPVSRSAIHSVIQLISQSGSPSVSSQSLSQSVSQSVIQLVCHSAANQPLSQSFSRPVSHSTQVVSFVICKRTVSGDYYGIPANRPMGWREDLPFSLCPSPPRASSTRFLHIIRDKRSEGAGEGTLKMHCNDTLGRFLFQ